MDARKEAEKIVSNVTNVAEKVVDKTQNLMTTSSNKFKNIGEQSLVKMGSVKKDAKFVVNTIGNNLKMISSMICSPALVYLAIGGNALCSSFIGGMDTTMFGARLVKLILWTYCLNFLCRNGYTSISWGVVMIPYILIPLQIVGLIKIPKKYLYALLSKDEQEFFGI